MGAKKQGKKGRTHYSVHRPERKLENKLKLKEALEQWWKSRFAKWRKGKLVVVRYVPMAERMRAEGYNVYDFERV